MKVLELINHLESIEDKTQFFKGTFKGIADNVYLEVWSCSGEYREIFASEDNNLTPISIAQAVEELRLSEDTDYTDIILTYGNEYDDIVSSLGGVEWVNNQLYLDTETCPRQI